ncbi:atrial natriuretic peptide receptor 1-like [Paramacrobiotus metropolitanus]|uniref:atrial natriuretic peptide receptor 1-like n=1 Tax=Paramacrobiotus metropolitanus TaxID=2943436 RepID=UPI002445D364|nr:atrial natriuretic peptide receptor 1-like [Paramacrobiotus metropolitanus]
MPPDRIIKTNLSALLILFANCLSMVFCINITFVSYGYGNVLGKNGGARHTAAGVSVAIDEFNWYKNLDYPDLNLTCNQFVLEIPKSSDCKDTEANYYMLADYYYRRKWSEQNLMALITSGCGDSLITGMLAREWDVFMGATAFAYPATRDRSAYPSYVTFSSIQVSVLADTMFALLDRYNWTNVGLIYDTSNVPSYYELVGVMQSQNKARRSPLRIGAVEVQLDKDKPFSPKPFLLTLKTYTRVIVLSMHPANVRKFMLAAHDLHMTNGEYVYITATAAPGYYVSGNLTWEMHDGQDETQDTMASVNINRYNLSFYPGDDNPNDYNIAAYQAFYVYLQILSEIFNETRKQAYGGASVARRMLGRQFPNAGFGEVFIDAGGQRQSQHCIQDLNITTGKFETAIRYDPYQKTLTNENNGELDFGGSGPPKNEPPCGYLGNYCHSGDSDSSSRTIPAVTGTIAVLGFLLWYLYKRLEREHQLKSNSWMLDTAFLKPLNEKAVSRDSVKSSRKNNYSLRNYDKPDYIYKDDPVSVKLFIRKHGRKVLEKRKDRKLLLQVSHPNIVPFVGVCMQHGIVHFLQKFCARGNLPEALQDSTYSADWDLRCSLLSDLIEGIRYIHGSPLKRHGSLTAAICLIDIRFTLLISELGFVDLVGPYHNLIAVDKQGTLLHESDRWADSTLTVNSTERLDGSGDILALAHIMKDMIKYSDLNSRASQQQRTGLQTLIGACAERDARQRPTIRVVRERFRAICKVSGDGLLANILTRMETYAAQLEKQVQDRTAALAKEQSVCEGLLLEMLPKWILDQLYTGDKITPDVFAASTVFFSHIWGFLHFVSTHNPYQIIEVINTLFTRFDKVVTNFAVYKVETVEDQYLVFSGKSDNGNNRHAAEICRMALAFKREFSQLRNDNFLQFLAGIHTGSCVAGVIGHKRPRYCLFGDTVNVASRIATNSKPSRIHISITTADIVRHCPEFAVRQRGFTSLKGRGEMQTFWLFAHE